MKTIRVYRNPHCAKCAKFAKANHFLDWLGRVDSSTDTPPTGPLRLGEIVIEEYATGQIHRGVEGVELIWHNIPLFMLFLPLLKIPAFRHYVDREARGCSGGACAMTPKTG
jgi:hypothetical protein